MSITILHHRTLNSLAIVTCFWLYSTYNTALAEEPVTSYPAEIITPGGPVKFFLAVDQTGGKTSATIACGGHEWSIQETVLTGDALTLLMPEFDAKIVAQKTRSGTYSGYYYRTRSADEVAKLPFAMLLPLPESLPDPPRGDDRPFEGRWRLRFGDDDEDAVAVLEAIGGGEVRGTIMTSTGDYRYLGGMVDRQSGRLSLSAFDGGHVFLITADQTEPGVLNGDFWSGDWYHTTWSATLDSDAQLPDGFGVSVVRDGESIRGLRFLNLEGVPVSLDDESLLGKVTIVELFGSWCPNCHDAAALLEELEKKYRNAGLKVVGLGFELTGDEQRD